ncbi:MAG TPA: hypothetical protein VK105_07205 [Virgibacillus sp.]|nr:hypothetical protein [Virgibacillus sp.]HLR66909.1 hypothetical protein [Virgibacillus sp.]
MDSFYEADKNCEEIVSKWIQDKIFTPQSFNGVYIRNENIQLQKSGIDFFLQSPHIFGDNKKYAVDEKCATSYIKTNIEDNNMPTFAFELDYQGQDGTRNQGWLFGDQFTKTEYYLICWLWAEIDKKDKKYLKDQVTYNNISKMKALLINKEKIQNYISSFHINNKNYMRASKRLREEKKETSIPLNPNKNKKTPKILQTKHLVEKPVNIIISEHDLIKLSDEFWEDIRP